MKAQNDVTGIVYSKFPKNISRYYLLRALVGMNGFYIAAVPSMWARAAMNDHDVALLEVWYSAVIIPLLLLGGAVADLKGRKTGMVIGLGSIGLGFATYTLFPSEFAMWCAELAIAVGWAFYLPADSSMLRDSLRSSGLGDLFEEVRSKGLAIGLSVMAITMVMGGWVAVDSPRICVAISALAMLFSAGFSVLFDEPVRAEIAHGIGVRARCVRLVSMVKNQIARDTELQRSIGLGAVLGSSGVVIFLFLQSYCSARGLNASHLGVVMAVNGVLAAALAKGMPALERRCGFRVLQLMAIGSSVLPLIVAGAWNNASSVPLFVMQAFGKAFVEVVLSARINAVAKDEDGATLNAISQIAFRLMAVVGCLVALIVPLPLGAGGIYFANAILSLIAIVLGANAIRIFSRRDIPVK